MTETDVREKGFFRLTPVEDALEILKRNVRPVRVERVLLGDSPGRVLAEDMVAGMDSPPFNRSAMDGYAVKGENTFGASQTNPIYFDVIGEIDTGHPADMKVGDFQGVRIFTGAPMPEGADAVVMFEYADEMGAGIQVTRPSTPGKNVSHKGEDVKKGDRLLEKGRKINPQEVAMLASLGVGMVRVFKKPRVAIFSTGDELVDPGKEAGPGEIFDANGPAITALVEANGGMGVPQGIVRDDYKKMKDSILRALDSDCDILVMSGATSVGRKDVIPEIVKEMGEILVHGVSMRPGEPTGFGLIGGKLLFMLPGNPVASIIGFETFVRSAIQVTMGQEPFNPYPGVKGVLQRKIASELGRRDFSRVKVIKEGSNFLVEPLRTGGSGIISSLVRADGMVVVPENTEGLEEGEIVEVFLFRTF